MNFRMPHHQGDIFVQGTVSNMAQRSWDTKSWLAKEGGQHGLTFDKYFFFIERAGELRIFI